MSKFWSPAVRSLVPYTPGEQPKVVNLIKLNTNENPYPPAPGVREVMDHFDIDHLRLYPDPEASELKQALADYYQLDTKQIFIGNGSDEVLALAFMTFFRQSQPLLMPEISYSFYEVYCDLLNIKFDKIALKSDFSIDLDDYRRPNGGIVFANPNAPTGRLLPLALIEKLLEDNTESVVLVDEAYVDFGGTSALSLVNRYPNLLVVQTLSKSRSLAGMRVGYAMGHPELIDGLERVKNSFNSYPLDRLAIATATAAIRDVEYFNTICKRIIDTREKAVESLKQLSFNVIPSATNFVFASHKQIAAADLMSFLREHNILVRHFTKPGIDNYLRISIGTDTEMQTMLQTLEKYPGIAD